MGSKANSVVCTESGSLWPRFKNRIKSKSKKHSSKPSASSNHAVEISPTRLISGKSLSESSVRIVSISRAGELLPVILSPVEEAISNERQPAKKEKPLGFDAIEIKIKSRDADISVKSGETEICTENLAPKQISEEEEVVAVRKSYRRSWVRISKAFRFTRAHDLHQTSRNGSKISQDSYRRSHAKDSEMPVVEQPKEQEIHQENEVADSSPRSIDYPSKFGRTSVEMDSKSCKLLKSIDFNRKLSSRASTPKSSFKGREIKSTPFSSSSTYPELPRPDINSTRPNSQPKKLKTWTERNGTITGDVTGKGEGYDMAINLSVLIIIMGCLAVFSDRLLAIVCTSLWWYLLPILLGRYSLSTTADIKMKRPVDPKQWRRSVSDVNAALYRGKLRKKASLHIYENNEER